MNFVYFIVSVCGPPLLRFIPWHLLLVEVPASSVINLQHPVPTVDANGLQTAPIINRINQYHFDADADLKIDMSNDTKQLGSEHKSDPKEAKPKTRQNPLERKVESKHLVELYNVVSL